MFLFVILKGKMRNLKLLYVYVIYLVFYCFIIILS